MTRLDIAAFVQDLRAKYIVISYKDGELEVDDPAGALTSEMEEVLAAQKNALVGYLENHPQSAGAVSIPKADRAERIPLSFIQEQLWRLETKDATNKGFHLPTALRMKGAVDAQVLEDAFRVLISRHESLRTNIVCESGRPWQRIHDGANWKVKVVDLSGLNDAEAEREAFLRIEKEGRAGFDLGNDSLLRTTLYKLKRHDFILFVDMHPIISDLRSLNILTQEITQIYHAFVKKEWPSLRPLPVQYADFAAWQRDIAPKRAVNEKRAYWGERLKGVAPFELPTDFVRPADSRSKNDVVAFEIDEKAVKGIRSLSRKEETPTDLILLASFLVLLHRYSGQDDICIGWVNPNRNEADLSSLIGLFANTLPLRTDLSGNPSFLEVLHGLKKTRKADCAYSDMPFEEILEVMKGNCTGSGPP